LPVSEQVVTRFDPIALPPGRQNLPWPGRQHVRPAQASASMLVAAGRLSFCRAMSSGW
jgi:hypothetical protein